MKPVLPVLYLEEQLRVSLDKLEHTPGGSNLCEIHKFSWIMTALTFLLEPDIGPSLLTLTLKSVNDKRVNPWNSPCQLAIQTNTLATGRYLCHCHWQTKDNLVESSGHCIDLSKRCDTKMDCADKSDEVGCHYVSLGDTYLKELIPRHKDSLDNHGSQSYDSGDNVNGNVSSVKAEPLKVFINISIMTFPSIDTVGLKFTADIFLRMRWYDKRVVFNNLVK